MGKKLGIGAVVLVVVFLAGFVPQYVQRSSLEKQLTEAVRQNQQAELRDLAGMAYVQAAQKNYGLAARTAADYFRRLGEIASAAPDPEKAELGGLGGQRDKITAELAKGDAGALDDLQALYLKTRAVTGK